MCYRTEVVRERMGGEETALVADGEGGVLLDIMLVRWGHGKGVGMSACPVEPCDCCLAAASCCFVQGFSCCCSPIA